MSDVSKYIPEEMAKNMPKSDSKIVEQEVYYTKEEVYIQLENKDPDSDYIHTAGVYIKVHKDSNGKVMSVSVEGGYNPLAWKDISKFIQSIS